MSLLRSTPAKVSVVLAATLLGTCPAWGRILHVTTAGDDVNDGLSWAAAKRTVQAGLDAASAGDQVWVAAGTYPERVTLKNGAALYGGFVGDETQLSQRNWNANATILSSKGTGSVVTTLSGATGSTRIDGFMIRNGQGAAYGGGIYCLSGSPAIVNNAITGSRAVAGGGIYCANASPTIENNTIAANGAEVGGGIYCTGGFPSIANNTIAANRADAGGGMYCTGGFLTLANNTIRENTASGGGGGVYCQGGSAMMVNNTITGNSANEGGGIYCLGASPSLANNTIAGNSAYAGGGICCVDAASPAIANTIIAFNSSGFCADYNPGSPSLRYNCVYGNGAYNYSGMADQTGSNGNLSADPRLAAAAYGNLHLQPDSPCRDAGDEAAVQAGWPDVDGQARIEGGHVDIGADESDGTAWPGGPYVIVRVSPEGDDARDGTSWSLAKRTVQAGIDAASGPGGEVWVRSGTYAERITLRPFAHVYGGFAGTENAQAERNWMTQPTILDGRQGGSVVTAEAGFRVGTIDGFTIRNGIGTIATTLGGDRFGGGIFCFGGSPTIANNTITTNSAHFGGGISCYAAAPAIRKNRITGNRTADSGGGVFCSISSPAIANNAIEGNTAHGNGGGIYCYLGSPIIANNTMTGNDAGRSGGGLDCFGASPAIVNNTIAANSAPRGGAFYCELLSATMANNVIVFNTSGVHVDIGGLPLSYNCVFGNGEYNYRGIGDATGRDGNISADPFFVRSPGDGGDGWGDDPDTPDVDESANDDHGDLRLQIGSPGIDAGGNAAVPVGITTDLDGNARFIDVPCRPDTGNGSPPIVDLGAYEWAAFTDCNGNGKTDPCDLLDGTSADCNLNDTPDECDTATGTSPDCNHNLVPDECEPGGAADCNGNGVPDLCDIFSGMSQDCNANQVPDECDIAAGISADVFPPSGDNVPDECERVRNMTQGLDYLQIQPALDAAADFDEIIVAPGTYFEAIDFLGKTVRLYSSNGATLTTLDGTGLNTSVVTCTSGGGPGAVLEGFTITNGTGTDLWSDGRRIGGGVYCDSCLLRIVNSAITGNMADDGGGIYSSSSSVTLTACALTGNSATSNGGAVLSNGGELALHGCTFTRNSAHQDGGALWLCAASTLLDCRWTENSAGGSGGGIMNQSNSLAVTNCLFEGNWALELGGGLSNVGGDVTVMNCAFSGGYASEGAGLENWRGSTRASNCTFAGNEASDGANDIYCWDYGQVTLANAIVSSGGPRGIVLKQAGELKVSFSNLVGGEGSVLVGRGSTLSWGVGNINADPTFDRTPGPGTDGIWGTVDDDYGALRLRSGSPCIDAGDNAAVPASVITDLAGRPRLFDDPATPDTGAGTPPIVDMGAYEFILVVAADFDGDGDVDLNEIGSFQACAAGPALPYAPSCALVVNAEGFIPADFDRDADVDQGDFAVLQRCYSGPGKPADPNCTH